MEFRARTRARVWLGAYLVSLLRFYVALVRLISSGELYSRIYYGISNRNRFDSRVRIVLWRGGERFLSTMVGATTNDSVDSASVFPNNAVRNQKYRAWSFAFVVLFEQFRFFFNLYFLLISLSQILPILRVGFLFTYVAPLAFVLSVTLGKEAFDDWKRFYRDREMNERDCLRLTRDGVFPIACKDIAVGDVVRVEPGQMVPADLVILRTTDSSGSCFIRTDQLDGETDLKLRTSIPVCQKLRNEDELFDLDCYLEIEAPSQQIHDFSSYVFFRVDGFSAGGGGGGGGVGDSFCSERLSLDHTMWSGTVLESSGPVFGCVIFTGKETRSAMNATRPRTKVGRLDLELNRLSKILFMLLVFLSFLMVIGKGFHGAWIVIFFRFIILFSSIIPISLRVNLDMCKTFCSRVIENDKEMPGIKVRNSQIPEELGRIGILLCDKTGTLTRNEMKVQKVRLDPQRYSVDDDILELRAMVDSAAVSSVIETAFTVRNGGSAFRHQFTSNATDDDLSSIQGLLAIALCHNVSPVSTTTTTAAMDPSSGEMLSFEGSSPDEVSLVQFARACGLSLISRNRRFLTVSHSPTQSQLYKWEILMIFPFSSERKRMGMVVRPWIDERPTETVVFLLKGADAVISERSFSCDWVEEEVDNMAREGLRTLVFATKVMSFADWSSWKDDYSSSSSLIADDRDIAIAGVMRQFESDLTIVAVTGVEDRLQEGVRSTIETLKRASCSVWCLTGDKLETALCVGVSAGLLESRERVSVADGITDPTVLCRMLERFVLSFSSFSLCIDGISLRTAFSSRSCRQAFMRCVFVVPSVIVCRASPTQKEDVAKMLKTSPQIRDSGRRVCCVGDGGNDVSMLQAAHVGVGIEGKEGKSAAMAADFSITAFSHLRKLIVWHGRNSYKRSARLSQFVIHRGLIISVIQAMFNAVFFFSPIALYTGWLMVGYTTYYTMAPVFSLILDEDVSTFVAFRYPELYAELQNGRVLSTKTFLGWVAVSLYQGGAILLGSVLLFENSFIHIVSITFTALVFSELLNVSFTMYRWHWLMILAQFFTAFVYIASVFVLPAYFDFEYMMSVVFLWKVSLITVFSVLPVFAVKYAYHKMKPPSYEKL